jgi:hypothetical protein
MDIASIPPGSAKRQSFVASFKSDMARILGKGTPPKPIATSRVLVTGLSSGSVIVDFTILPDLTNEPVEQKDLEQAFEAPGVVLGGVKTTGRVTVDAQSPAAVLLTVTAMPTQKEGGRDLTVVVVVMGGGIIIALIGGVAYYCSRKFAVVAHTTEATVISVDGAVMSHPISTAVPATEWETRPAAELAQPVATEMIPVATAFVPRHLFEDPWAEVPHGAGPPRSGPAKEGQWGDLAP